MNVCVAEEQLGEETRRQLDSLFQYSVTGDSAYLLAPQRPLMTAQDEDGDRYVSPADRCSNRDSVRLTLLSPDSGLHLAVLHSQQEALRSLAQVVSVLPGEEVLNLRNHLYQVCHFSCLLFLFILKPISAQPADRADTFTSFPRLLCTWR